METITIGIKGMTCGGCVAAVQRALQGLEGVRKVEVSLERGDARVEYSPGQVNVDRLRAAVEDAGFDVAV